MQEKPRIHWAPLPTLFLSPAAMRWYGEKLVRHITSWFWAAVSTSCHEVQWVSHFQLYIDFMLTTGMPGPIKKDRWYDGADFPFLSLHNYSFRQRARWFTKVLKETLRHMQIKLSFDYKRPASQMVLMYPNVHWGCCCAVVSTAASMDRRLDVASRWPHLQTPDCRD